MGIYDLERYNPRPTINKHIGNIIKRRYTNLEISRLQLNSMAIIWRSSLRIFRPSILCRMTTSGDDGVGSGKGDGSDGSVRKAGEAFAKRELAEEVLYIRKAEAELLAKLSKEHQKIRTYYD